MLVRRQSSRGFSIMELMVVVAIVGILAMIAVPSFKGMLAMMRVKTMAGEIQSALTQARSDAMKRNTDVTVTPAASGWQGGWTVTASGVATPLQTRDAMTVGAKNITSSSTASVVFRANGRSTNPDAVITLSSTDTSLTRCVKISLSGPPIVRESCS